MHQESTLRTTHLARRQTFSLRAHPGQIIECESGQLWVTQDGDPRDVILGAHECFRPDRTGPMVVSALVDASFGIRPFGSANRIAGKVMRAPAGTPARAPALSCAY